VQPLGQGLPAGQFDDLKALDGGNRGVSPRVFLPAVGVCADDAFGLIPMAGPPNRGLFALELLGHGSSPVACGPRQDDSSASHLEPWQALAPSDLQEVRFVGGTDANLVFGGAWQDASRLRRRKGGIRVS
jgi:hypothetical protein